MHKYHRGIESYRFQLTQSETTRKHSDHILIQWGFYALTSANRDILSRLGCLQWRDHVADQWAIDGADRNYFLQSGTIGIDSR